MTKVFYSKEPIKIGKCLNDEPLKPIKPKRKPFKNPFINTSYVDRIVDNFFKEQMKDAMRNQIERFGFTLHNVHLHFANGVDRHTMELADEAYNEVLNEFGINK